jgi:hypothetical protein
VELSSTSDCQSRELGAKDRKDYCEKHFKILVVVFTFLITIRKRRADGPNNPVDACKAFRGVLYIAIHFIIKLSGKLMIPGA